MLKRLLLICSLFLLVFLQPIIRADSSALQNLEISNGELNPAFSGDVLFYTVNVDASVAEINVTPTSVESGASITVNGQSVSSGQPSGNIELNEGDNTITVAVTSPDLSTTTVYTITVNKDSLDTYLSTLVLNTPEGGPISLNPAFVQVVFSYTASVSNSITNVTVIPTAEESTSIVKVNNEIVSSGQPSGSISLNVGTNTITIDVIGSASQKTYTIILTRNPLPTGSITINNNAAYSNSTSVTLNLTASASVSFMRFSSTSAGIQNAVWETYSPARANWILASGNGYKYVYAQFKDDYDLTSPIYSDYIYLDTTAPTGTLSFQNGATCTQSRTVVLNLSAADGTGGSGVTSMRISNTYADLSSQPWRTYYAGSQSWTLLDGDGPKTVYIQYRDAAGNISGAYQARILLDTVAPIGSIKINNGASEHNTANVTLNLLVTDGDGSGVSMMRFSNDNGTSWSAWEIYLTRSKNWTLQSGTGVRNVTVQFKDNAGNTSNYSDSINIGTTPSPVFLTGNTIAFSSNRTGNREIFVMNENGTCPTNISNNTANDFEPDLSRDQRKIVFVSDRTGDNDIFIMDADGSNQVNLTNYPGASDNSPVLSRDGKKIAFVSNRTGNNDIFVMNADGSGTAVNLTNCASGYSAGSPSWSPDGLKIAFDYTNNGVSSIYTMSSYDGSGRTLRASGSSSYSYVQPSWSPEGTEIAVICINSGRRDIWLMASQGTMNYRTFTTNTLLKNHPAWSPDGTKVAFTANNCIYTINVKDGSQLLQLTTAYNDYEPSWSGISSWLTGVARCKNSDIYVTNADRYSRITNTPENEEDPIMSPDKTSIQFVRYDSTNSTYYLSSLNIGTNTIINLCSSSNRIHSPTWSPNGSKIAFVSGYGSTYNVYTVDGSGIRNLTNQIDNVNSWPSWSPNSSQIAFASTRGTGGQQVYTMDQFGGSQTQFTNVSGGSAWSPRWSPDGNKIAYVSNETGSEYIYTRDCASPRTITKITAPTYYDCYPWFWSPDSMKIIMVINIDQVWVVNATSSSTPYELPVFRFE